MASMKAITVDWLSSSKFGSARPTSQTRADHSGNDHGLNYRGLTDSPADLAEKCVRLPCKQAPTRRQCTWVFSVMNHPNASHSSDAPVHSLGHRQGFVGDHRLQRGVRALLGGGDGSVSFSERRQHLDGKLLQAPVMLGPFTTTSHPAVRRGAAGSRPRPPPSRFLQRTGDRSGRLRIRAC